MQIHDLRCSIIADSEQNFIRKEFPLRMGAFPVELRNSYDLNCKYEEWFTCSLSALVLHVYRKAVGSNKL